MTPRFDAAVVGRARDVPAIAAGAAATLAGRSATHTAVVVVVAGDLRRGPNVPSTPAARRMRARLRARDLDARAAGRIVWTSVGDGDDAAAGIYGAAALEVPLVLAVCGPREPWVEPLLDDAAIVLIAGEADDALAALALDALDARGLPAAVVLAPAGLGAVLARAGLARASSWPVALPVATEAAA